MWCWVVVTGSGSAGAAPAVWAPEEESSSPEAGAAVSATRAPSERRLAREEAGTKRSCSARRRARERPRESSQGSRSERSRTACRRASISAASETGDTLASAAARPRAALRRRARERASDASQGSRVARSRAYPDMRRHILSGFAWAPTGLAVGLARCATPQTVAIRPRSPGGLHWVPRSRSPWGVGLGTTEGTVPGIGARCITWEGVQRFLPTAHYPRRQPPAEITIEAETPVTKDVLPGKPLPAWHGAALGGVAGARHASPHHVRRCTHGKECNASCRRRTTHGGSHPPKSRSRPKPRSPRTCCPASPYRRGTARRLAA